MTGPRLTPGFWVRATIRACEVNMIPAFVLHKGLEEAGSVLIKLNRFAAGCVVYGRVTGVEGAGGWMAGTGEAPVAEPQADDYIRRQLGYDRDLWVVEIEDQNARFDITRVM